MTRRVVKLDLASGEPIVPLPPLNPNARNSVFINTDDVEFSPAEAEPITAAGVELHDGETDDWNDATPWVVSSGSEAIVFRCELDALRAVATLVADTISCKPVTFGEVV